MSTTTTNTTNPIPGRFAGAAAFGLRLFPVLPRHKKPVGKWSAFSEREPSAEELSSWDSSDFNVGVICGDPSGIVVLDVDSPEAQAIVDDLALPPTPTVLTSRGRHYYFRQPAQELRNAVNIGGAKLDLRGEGGYVVGAGSVHDSGHVYCWEVSPEEVLFADVPENLMALLSARATSRKAFAKRSGADAVTGGRFDHYLAASLAAALSDLNKTTEGGRNDALFRNAAQVANDVAGADAEWEPYARALRQVALQIGLDEAETADTLVSAWRTGSAQPTPWMLTAKQWIYLSKPNVFYHVESREYVPVESFNNTFLSQNVSKSHFSKFLLKGEYVEVVHDRDFVPRLDEPRPRRGGLIWCNTYRPSDVVAVPGDASYFAEFLDYLVPDDDERAHLLKMIAWTVRNPSRKLRHALLFRVKAVVTACAALDAVEDRLPIQ